MIQEFFHSLPTTMDCYTPIKRGEDTCRCIKNFWYQLKPDQKPNINNEIKDPIDHVGAVFPGVNNQWSNELVLLDKEVNNIKEGFWGKNPSRNEFTLQDYAGHGDSLFKNVKDTITAIRYHIDPIIRQHLINQKDRVGNRLTLLETQHLNQITRHVDGMDRTWRPLGLQAEWNRFMRARAARAITASQQHVTEYLNALKEGHATQAQRNLAWNGGDEDWARAARALITKIDALNVEWTQLRPVWTNPF